MIIIPIKWLFHWEYTLFSDKPILLPFIGSPATAASKALSVHGHRGQGPHLRLKDLAARRLTTGDDEVQQQNGEVTFIGSIPVYMGFIWVLYGFIWFYTVLEVSHRFYKV